MYIYTNMHSHTPPAPNSNRARIVVNARNCIPVKTAAVVTHPHTHIYTYTHITLACIHEDLFRPSWAEELLRLRNKIEFVFS